MPATSATVTEELAAIDARLGEAGRNVEALEREQAATFERVREIASQLAQHEREGGTATARTKIEAALVEARRATEDPALPARLEGARQRLRDLRAERQAYIGEHLRELIAVHEEQGRVVAARLNEAASQLLACYSERESIASAISGLAAAAGRVQPGDVSRSRAEQVARAVAAFVSEGGEEPPVLVRDPSQPRRGQLAEVGQPAEVERADVVRVVRA